MGCALCGAEDPRPLSPPGVYRCRGCGLVYRPQRLAPAALRRYYARQYPLDTSARALAARSAVYQGFLRRLGGPSQAGRVLDVGAGAGLFLRDCRALGWRVEGLEPARRGREHALRAYGIQLMDCSLKEARFAPESFDLVSFWNVLGHLDNPLAALEQARLLLKPGGLAVARFPDARFHLALDGLFRKAARLAPALAKYNPAVFHLYSFTPASLARFFAAAGLAPGQAEPSPLAGAPAARLSGALVKGAWLVARGRLGVAPSLIMTARKPYRGGG